MENMSSGIQEILDSMELAKRVIDIRDYAQIERENMWEAMNDHSNGMTEENRRLCCMQYAKKDMLFKILEDLVTACHGFCENSTADLYDTILRKLK